MDIATKENLEKLSNIGDVLLKKPACNSTDMSNEEARMRLVLHLPPV
jgi:hypothetical protein